MVGKKKRGHPDVEDLLARPWCYYCERDFDDLKILISHQKAKHFKCERCGRRLYTAGGLSVHMNQVHKETLTNVENALPNRQGLEVEIFGMEGIPEDVEQAHNQRIIAGFYQAEAERRAASGSSGPGGGNAGQAKKPKFESPADLKKRLAEHKARKAEQATNNSSGGNTPLESHNSPSLGQSPAAFNGSPYTVPQATYGGSQGAGYGSFSQESYTQPTAAYQQPASGPPGAPYQPHFSPPAQYSAQSSFPPPGYQQPQQNFPGAPQYGGSPPASFGTYQPPTHTPPQVGGLPNRPSSLPPPPGLPQRPSFGAPPVAPYQMQQMHQVGQQHQQGGWGGNGWSGQDQKSAMSSAYPPHSQGYGEHSTNASTVDDLVAGASREPDEYDEAIRMAIAGIKPPKKVDAPSGSAQAIPAENTNSASVQTIAPAPAAEKPEPTEKKLKKDKPMKMIYSDNEISPEEKMAKFARYAFVPEGKTESTLFNATSVPRVAGTVDA